MRTGVAATVAAFAAAVLAGPVSAAGNPDIAALQVGLHTRGLYSGNVDGVLGSSTASAVKRFQAKAGLVADGIPGARTRAALGRYGKRAPLGRRPLVLGARGWDVAALQFALAWHGFPSGPFDGHLGLRTQTALIRFQVWARLKTNGTAGPSTIAALRAPLPRSPIRLRAPVEAPLGDLYGPRGNRFHSGVDFMAPSGTAVAAAGAGKVVFAGTHASGWGNLVVIAHGSGVRTLYAHLARIRVRVGQRVATGATVGTVGATGHATGPHLHLEVLVRGAAVDPQMALR